MRLIRAISYFFKKRPWATLGLIALLFVSVSVEGIGIGFLVPLLEMINNQGDVGRDPSQVSLILSAAYEQVGLPFTLLTIISGGFLLFLLQAVLRYFAGTLTILMANRATAEVRTQIFDGLLNADLAYIHKRKGSEFVNTIIVECNRFQGAFLASVRLLTGLTASVVYLSLALYLSWQLVLAALVLIAAVLLLVKYEFTRASRYGDDLTDVNEGLQGTAMEQLSGMRILKAFSLESMSSKLFRKQAYELLRVYYAMAKSQARLDAFFQIGMLGGLFLAVYLGVSFFSISVPVLLTFIFLLYRFYPRVSGINKAYHQLTFGIAGVNNVMNLIRETETPSIRSGPMVLAGFRHEIRFDGVTFGYDEESPVLSDLSFGISRGGTTAVVGSSGAGKTTIANLIMRFYDPSAGRILVDGTDLRELDLQAWRGTIALVNQDIFLFNDTISSNIAKGKQGAAQEEIVEAAKRAHADEFIQELPQKYATRIGDRGVRLSGGQRQRIALARAVIRDPRILILDEATSELDSISEQLIRQAVEELEASRTVITIAHRLSTIRHAEKIIVLDRGRLVEEGRHEDLIKDNGRYAEFLQIQETAATDGS